MEVIPGADVTGKLLQVSVGDYGFLIVATALSVIIFTQFAKIAIEYGMKKDLTKKKQVFMANVVTFLLATAAGIYAGYDLEKNSFEFFRLFGLIGWMSKMLYIYGFDALFNKVGMTPNGLKEEAAEKELEKAEGLA